MSVPDPSRPRERRDGLLVCGDLFFSTKIEGTARALGLAWDTADTVAQGLDLLGIRTYRTVLVDLALSDLAVVAVVMRVREVADESGTVPVIAFGPHVLTERFEAARQAGCADVLPHSRLTAQLVPLLKAWSQPS